MIYRLYLPFFILNRRKRRVISSSSEEEDGGVIPAKTSDIKQQQTAVKKIKEEKLEAVPLQPPKDLSVVKTESKEHGNNKELCDEEGKKKETVKAEKNSASKPN